MRKDKSIEEDNKKLAKGTEISTPKFLLLNQEDRNRIVKYLCETKLPCVDVMTICSCLNNLKVAN